MDFKPANPLHAMADAAKHAIEHALHRAPPPASPGTTIVGTPSASPPPHVKVQPPTVSAAKPKKLYKWQVNRAAGKRF